MFGWDWMSQNFQLVMSGITSGCVYAIVAIGFSVIYNSTQVINFAQGEFVMIGAMVAAVLLAKFGLLVAFPVAILAGCLVGLLVALFVLIPAKKGSVITLIIVTIGASIMFKGLAQLFWGESAIPVPAFTGVKTAWGIEDRTFHILGAVIGAQDVWVVAVTALLVLGMYLFFKYALVGKAMRAAAMNSTGARLVGINVRRMIVISFVMASALGAVAGVTVAPVFYAKCNMGMALGLNGFCAAVLGGLGNFGGGVVAGILLGIVEKVFGGIWSDYREAISFIILLLILFVRPQGLIARKSRKG